MNTSKLFLFIAALTCSINTSICLGAQSCISEKIPTSGNEVILVPKDDSKSKSKGQWHRIPARIPIMLYLDDHTLYSIGNDECYLITIEVKDEQGTPIALYTIPDNKTEPIVLPESWNGRFKILVSYCERIYEGHIDLTR